MQNTVRDSTKFQVKTATALRLSHNLSSFIFLKKVSKNYYYDLILGEYIAQENYNGFIFLILINTHCSNLIAIDCSHGFLLNCQTYEKSIYLPCFASCELKVQSQFYYSKILILLNVQQCNKKMLVGLFGLHFNLYYK